MSEEERRIGVDLGTGWLPDYPDYRDYGPEEEERVPERAAKLGEKSPVKEMLGAVGIAEPSEVSLPSERDWRGHFSRVENQGTLGSCTAQAGVGLVEYYERRAFGRYTDASRLFLYKTTRNLLHWMGDRGAFLRTTMGAMVLFGVPPEEYWPYRIPDFDKEPPAFCYAFAQNYQAIQYFRLDPPGASREALLARIKLLLAYGLPSMFGFTVFSSYVQAADDGRIPFPSARERRLGGHAVVAAGYDDNLTIRNESPGGEKTKGALLIRNSWGRAWGEGGYGWLPYKYVLKGLAIDWWCLLKSEWVNTRNFGLEG